MKTEDEMHAEYVRAMERAGKCERVHEAWGPNEGCAEFMDSPETFDCQNDATHFVVTKEFDGQFHSVAAENLCSDCYVLLMTAYNTGQLDYTDIVTFGRLQ